MNTRQKRKEKISDPISNSLEDAKISVPKPKIEKVAEPKKIDYVYEVKFKNENSSYLLFASKIDLNEDSLALFNAFTRYILHENINPQDNIIVEEIGRKELSEKDLQISLIYGVEIKKILKEEWMDRNEDETKKIFDEKVLKTYRDYKNSLTKLYNNTMNQNNQNNNENYSNNNKKDNRYEGFNRREIQDI